MTWPAIAGLALGATQSVFGEPATYTPLVGAPVAVVVIFDAAHVDNVIHGEIVVESIGPAAGVTLADLPGDAAELGAGLTVRSLSFTVNAIRPDGHGGALLMLTAV